MTHTDKNTELTILSTIFNQNLYWWVAVAIGGLIVFWIITRLSKHIKIQETKKQTNKIFQEYEELETSDKNWIEDILIKTGCFKAIEFMNNQMLFEEVIDRYRKLYPHYHPNIKNLPTLRQKIGFTIQHSNVRPRNTRYFYSDLNLKAYALYGDEFLDYQARVLVVYEHELWITPPDFDEVDSPIDTQFPVTLVVSRNYEKPLKFTCKIIHEVHQPRKAIILKHAEFADQLSPRIAPRKKVEIRSHLYLNNNGNNADLNLMDGIVQNISAKGAEFQTHHLIPTIQEQDQIHLRIPLANEEITLSGIAVNTTLLNHEFRNIHIKFTGGIERDLKILRKYISE